MFLQFILIITFTFSIVYGQNLIQSGPMLGYADMREALIWVQTQNSAKVQIEYFEDKKPEKKFKTDVFQTQKTNAFCAKLICDQVEPGIFYQYSVIINDKVQKFNYPTTFSTPTLWQFRTEPKDFKMVLGSCAFINEEIYDRPGKPYGKSTEIFKTIANQKPDLMVWLGDNVYFREVDYHSKTGIYKRYTHDRSTLDLQPLLANTHHLAIWDDHDYGTNDANRSFWNKEISRNAFIDFWGNPSYGLKNEGITSKTQWEDVEIYMLDNRWFRSPNELKNGKKEMLGETQFQWLIDNLVSSKASFKIIAVGSQVLNNVAKFENFAIFEEERKKLLDAIQKENVKGVVFVTGDRHCSEMSVLDGSTKIYDVTTSPLTSGVYDFTKEENSLRIPGSVVAQNNFAEFTFSGPFKSRKLKIEFKNQQNEVLFTKELSLSDF